MRLATALLVFCAANAAERPYIAVVEKVAGAVGFYAEDGRQIALVKTGPFPHEAVLSPDGGTLYVSNNGVLWMTEDSLGYNQISVVDVRAMRKIRDIDLGTYHRPHGIALVGGRIFATTERPFGLVMVDPAAGKVLRGFDVKGKSPHMVIPAAGGKRVFVSDTDSDTLAAIDIASGETRTVATGAHPQGGVISHDGSLLYLTNTNGNQIQVIDTESLQVKRAIPTGKGPARIALTPDGKTLVYNLQFEPGVGFADVAAGRQVAQVALTGRPLSLTMTRDGRRAFAGVQDQDKVAFLSVSERKIERTIELPKGSGPDPAIPLQ